MWDGGSVILEKGLLSIHRFHGERDVLLTVMSCWMWCHTERDVMLSVMSCWARFHAEHDVMLSVKSCWAWCYAERDVMLSVRSCWVWCHAEREVMLSVLSCWAWCDVQAVVDCATLTKVEHLVYRAKGCSFLDSLSVKTSDLCVIPALILRKALRAKHIN